MVATANNASGPQLAVTLVGLNASWQSPVHVSVQLPPPASAHGRWSNNGSLVLLRAQGFGPSDGFDVQHGSVAVPASGNVSLQLPALSVAHLLLTAQYM